MHKRLQSTATLFGPCRHVLATFVLAALVAGCSQESNPLAPYDGHRDLEFLHVTQSFTPDIQWVGGRVAAVGVNRGSQAGLDSTLVWLRMASDNSISSVVTVGPNFDAALVESFGGVPASEIDDDETYTFWIAAASAVDAGLVPGQYPSGAFADTTISFQLVMFGQGGGDPNLGVQFRVIRDESLIEGEQFVVSWTPENLAFRQLAIRQATVGGWTNLIWHIRTPEGESPSITTPLVIGEAPDGVQEVISFPESGFEPATHLLWANTDGWNETFQPSATGYAWFRILAANFPN